MLGDNAETRRRRRVGSAEVWVRPRLSGRIWRYTTENGRVGSFSLPSIVVLGDLYSGESDTRKLIARSVFCSSVWFANKIANAMAIKRKKYSFVNVFSFWLGRETMSGYIPSSSLIAFSSAA